MNSDPYDSQARSGLPRWACRLLAGLDAGTLAASAVLAWFMLHGALRGDFWWSRLNVAAAPFYGERIFSMGFGRATIAGGALLFVSYSLLGVAYSMFARTAGLRRAVFGGVLWMMLWHILAQRFIWRAVDASGPLYFTQLTTLPAHLAAGLLLGRFPARFRTFALLAGHPNWTPGLFPATAAADQARSGASAPGGQSGPAGGGTPDPDC